MGKATESLEEFYNHKFAANLTENRSSTNGQFNVFRIADRIATNTTSANYIRRDFYKIMLFCGNNVFHYADRSIKVEGNTLLFFNPKMPYTYDLLDQDTTGYFCVFKEEFFQDFFRINLGELPLFTAGSYPVFHIDDKSYQEINLIFLKIFSAIEKENKYKYELIRSYVSELIFLALGFHPIEDHYHNIDASSRIAVVFNELLERQFPIESPLQRFELRSPKVIADRLSLHVNYLNRAVKKATGRTTSDHIFERITAEAKALLKHTNWNIAEISYALGFEDQAHFNRFFKKQTNSNPSSFRQV